MLDIMRKKISQEIKKGKSVDEALLEAGERRGKVI